MRLIRYSLMFLMTMSFAFAGPAAPQKEWTLLVYINGHNNLDSYGKEDINEMENVGSSNRVNVVVQWASSANRTTKRLYVEKDESNSNVVKSRVVQDMPRVDMGDWRNLLEFIQWGAANYPAKHYFVAVWNHGSGWRLSQKSKSQGIGVMDISFDDISGNSITTLELGQTMDAAAKSIGKKIDIYGSDACLMGMVEVAAQMENSVQYFVGSQDLEPGDGWPYDQFLKKWNALPQATPDVVSKLLVDEYVSSYSGGSQGSSEVTLSAYDVGKITPLYNAVGAIGTELSNLSSPQKTQVLQVIKNTFNFAYSDYADFGNFIDGLGKSQILTDKKAKLDQAKKALAEFVIANRTTSSFAKATGVAIWLPWSSGVYGNYQQLYRNLNFHKRTAWGDALNGILNP